MEPLLKTLAHVLFKRLKNRDFPVFLLDEQFRQAEGLVDAINEVFYDNKIKNGAGPSLSERPRPQAAVKWIKERYDFSDGIPISVLTSRMQFFGAAAKADQMYSLRNIAAICTMIRKMLDDGRFK